MVELLIVLFIMVWLPWFVISSLKNFFQRRANHKAEEKRRKEYELNPLLRHEAQIRLLSNHLKFKTKNDFLLLTRYYKISAMDKYFTPVSDKANEIRNEIESDIRLDEKQRTYLYGYLEKCVGEKIEEEMKTKQAYEVKKLIEKEEAARRKKLIAERLFRRKKVIDRLVGKYSYVLLDDGSELLKRANQPFGSRNEPYMFKSNIWEYTDGKYIIFGGFTYEEGVINLFENLIKLKKKKAIKRIDTLNDPRTV